MKDIKKNKAIVADIQATRNLHKGNRSTQEGFTYSNKKSYVDKVKRKKKQDYFSAYINNVDFNKKLPF